MTFWECKINFYFHVRKTNIIILNIFKLMEKWLLRSRKVFRISETPLEANFWYISRKSYLSSSACLSASKRASSIRSSSALLSASNLSCSAISAKRASSWAFKSANLASSSSCSNLRRSASAACLFSSSILQIWKKTINSKAKIKFQSKWLFYIK